MRGVFVKSTGGTRRCTEARVNRLHIADGSPSAAGRGIVWRRIRKIAMQIFVMTISMLKREHEHPHALLARDGMNLHSLLDGVVGVHDHTLARLQAGEDFNAVAQVAADGD